MDVPMKCICILGFLVVLGIIVGFNGVERAGECGKSTTPDMEAFKLAPCASAGQDKDVVPSSSCCLQVKKIGQNLRCLCAVMLSNTTKSSGVKPEVAATIPKCCNLADRPVGYKCGVFFADYVFVLACIYTTRFVQGIKHGRQTGFDLDDSDLLEMEQCRGVVVASTKFGAYDLIQPPKNISETAKKNVSFFVFVDEETDTFLRNSTELNSSKKVGLWRIVVIHNLPYDDPRRNGKKGTLLGPLHTRASR